MKPVQNLPPNTILEKEMARKFHHTTLPDFSTLLSGHTPPDEVGFQSTSLQIWYNNQDGPWTDPQPHAHTEGDECFIVLKGELIVDVNGERHVIGPREFCCFPKGTFHQILEVHAPIETLMIRTPSKEDKIYKVDSVV
jgi:mannose-6-phosphate isomerase-like protein (cupin superfamily)